MTMHYIAFCVSKLAAVVIGVYDNAMFQVVYVMAMAAVITGEHQNLI